MHATQLMNAQDFINLNEEVYKKIQNELLHINQLTENFDAQMKKFIVNLKNTFIFSYQQLQFLNNETINNTITSILRFNRREDILNKKFIKFTELQKGTLKELQNKISSDYQFVIFYVDYQNKNPLHQQEIPRGNQLGQLRQSIECYEEAIKINPLNDHAWSSKGDCLRLLQKYEESIIRYNQALSINPKNELALCGKGDSLRILGQNSQQRNYQEKESQNQVLFLVKVLFIFQKY